MARIIKVVASKSKQKYLHGDDQVKMTVLNEMTWVDCLPLNIEPKHNLLECSILQRVTESRIWQSRKSSIILENFLEKGVGGSGGLET